MAHSLSAKKRVRQNIKHAAHNRSYKSQIRTQRRSVLEKLAAKEPKNVEEFRKIVSLIQRVAAKGVVHKNKASNMVARLSRRMHQATAKSASAK